VSRAELTPLTNAHGLVIDPRVAKVYEADDAKKTLWVFGPSQAEIFDTVTQYLQKNPKAKVQVLTGYRNPTSGKTEADKVITYSRGVSGLPRPSSRKATTADIEASSTEHFVREAGQTVEPAEATEKRSEGPRAVPRLYTYKENGQDVLDVIGGGPNEAFESARTYAARQPEGTIVRFDSKRTNETTGAEQSMRGAFVSDGKGGTMVLLTDPNTSMPFAAPNMQALGTPTAELLYEGS
jgi:hypothetical protein